MTAPFVSASGTPNLISGSGLAAPGVASLEETLSDLKGHGLVGMEVYYGDYSPEDVNWLAGIARNLDLIPCGGSDYHASGNPGEPEPGSVGPPMKTYQTLLLLKQAASGAP